MVTTSYKLHKSTIYVYMYDKQTISNKGTRIATGAILPFFSLASLQATSNEYYNLNNLASSRGDTLENRIQGVRKIKKERINLRTRREREKRRKKRYMKALAFYASVIETDICIY